MILVDGKKIAASRYADLRSAFELCSQVPDMHIIYVGSDPVIDTFVRFKERAGQQLGVRVVVHNFPSDITEQELMSEINTISQVAGGLVVQLPLPAHIDDKKILSTLPVHLDIDVLAQATQEAYVQKQLDFVPPVAGALDHIMTEYNLDFSKLRVVLLGYGRLVGHPVSLWLDRLGYTYEIIDKDTKVDYKKELLAKADVIISGIGQPQYLHADMISEGVMLFDCGTSELNKKVVGDIHPSVYSKASLLTPVPGGVGPLTIVVLYENLLKAYLKLYD